MRALAYSASYLLSAFGQTAPPRQPPVFRRPHRQAMSERDHKRARQPPLVFANANMRRLDEVQQILAAGEVARPFEMASRGAELQGDDATEIAIVRCNVAAEKVNGPVLCEDTCLCLSALGGWPGPNIYWYLLEVGLLGLYKKLAGYEDKSAYAQCVFALCAGPGCEVHIFDGRTQGRIVLPCGSEGLGWEPVFQPDEGRGLTFAEMTKDAKNAISHRGRALESLRKWLLQVANEFKREGVSASKGTTTSQKYYLMDEDVVAAKLDRERLLAPSPAPAPSASRTVASQTDISFQRRLRPATEANAVPLGPRRARSRSARPLLRRRTFSWMPSSSSST